jgi:hypothetical protein
MNFSGEVTVTSMDPNNPAVLSGLNVSNSSNLTFTDLEVKVDPTTGFAVYLGSDNNIKLDGLNLHGAAVGDGSAVMARNSTNITVSDSDIHHLQTGINHLNSNGLTFSDNRLHDLQSDGIRGGGSSNVTIADNHFTNFYPKTGDHPDAIQFWTTNTTTAAHDIVISGNVFVRGAGGAIQGIFIGNENKIPYQNVTVTDNAIIGGMYHGISLSYGNNVTVEGNLVAGYTDMTSWIMLNYTTNSTITDNDATAYQLATGNINLLNTLNSGLSQLVPGDLLPLNEWLAVGGRYWPQDPPPQQPTGSDATDQPPDVAQDSLAMHEPLSLQVLISGSWFADGFGWMH